VAEALAVFADGIAGVFLGMAALCPIIRVISLIARHRPAPEE
jgi:hypothetical protein